MKMHIKVTPRPRKSNHSANGPGTILKQMLTRIGIHATPNCKCNRRAAEMDSRGPAWCEQNIDLIESWLAEESAARGLPFIKSMGRLLILAAIRRSRRRSKNALIRTAGYLESACGFSSSSASMIRNASSLVKP
jgi:hypothetical protein